MPNLTCHALIFDLDGVLIDSNDIYEAHWCVWAEERNISCEHILAIHHGRPVEETIAEVAPHLDAHVEAQAYKNGLERGHYLDFVRAYAGAHDLLALLPYDRWAIATSAPRAFALSLLDQLELPRPRTFVSGEDVGAGKPQPFPFLRAAWSLKRDIKDCVVVEDAPAGITAARRAGARVIALSTTNPRERLREADFIVRELAELSVSVQENGLQIDLQKFNKR